MVGRRLSTVLAMASASYRIEKKKTEIQKIGEKLAKRGAFYFLPIFLLFFPCFFFHFLAICLPIFWIWGVFYSVAGRRNRNTVLHVFPVLVFRLKLSKQQTPQRARRGISMPRGKNCRETIFAAQLPRNYPHRRGNFETGKESPLLWGGRQHFKRQFG